MGIIAFSLTFYAYTGPFLIPLPSLLEPPTPEVLIPKPLSWQSGPRPWCTLAQPRFSSMQSPVDLPELLTLSSAAILLV